MKKGEELNDVLEIRGTQYRCERGGRRSRCLKIRITQYKRYAYLGEILSKKYNEMGYRIEQRNTGGKETEDEVGALQYE